MEKLFRLRLYHQEVVSRVLFKQHLDPVKNKKRKNRKEVKVTEGVGNKINEEFFILMTNNE